ncbi:S24 family peptidase [Rhodopseudomonas sp.]|uniref:S24 family peptidase n=1 Tax=Rhodopseudomonas sp. TaxID=1078 RepID=UPI0039E6B505
MIKKTSTPVESAGVSDQNGSIRRKKSLEIRQIRSFVEQLENLPDGASLPDWSDLTVGDRFAIVVRLIPQAEREDLLGKSEGHVRRYERGVDIPLTVVAALAAATEIPLEWIVSGRAMERKPPLVYVTPERQRSDPDDVKLQKLAFKASAGDGALVIDEDAEYVGFPREILERERLAAQNARLMEAFGDSMRPTISDGDMLLIDTSNAGTQIVEGRIYVFSIGDDAFVKRLRRIGRKIVMVSDNRETFPDVEIPNELPFRIYGRVRWAGRSL